MLNTWLSDSTIALRKNVATWQQALDICARPLLEAEIITADYLSAIKTQHEKLGPYYVWLWAGHAACPTRRRSKRIRVIIIKT